MLSREQLLKIDPGLASLTEGEMEELKANLYDFAQLAFEVYWDKRLGSNNPIRSLPQLGQGSIINHSGRKDVQNGNNILPSILS